MTSDLLLLCTEHSLAVLKGVQDPPPNPLTFTPNPITRTGALLTHHVCTAGLLWGVQQLSLSLFFKFYEAPTHTSLHYATQPFLESLRRKESLKIQLWVPFDLHHEFRDAFPWTEQEVVP